MTNGMKKILSSAVALLMTLVMLFSMGAFAEEGSDPVLVTINGTPVTQSEAENYLWALYYNGYLDDMYDLRGALDYIVKATLLEDALRAEGCYNLSEEKTEELRVQALEEKQAYVDYYVSYYLTEDTEEARAALRAEAEEYYAGYEEDLLEGYLYNEAYDVWSAGLVAAEVTDEELKALYEQYAEEDKELFEGDVYTYEYQCYNGYYPFYTPAGYRYVRRLVLTVDSALLEAWYNAQIAFEDGAEGENADALKATAEEAMNAVLASVQEKITTVQDALANSSDFITVSDQYTEDQYYVVGDANLIMINADSIVYDYYFVRSAFDDAAAEKGSIGGPFVTQEGVLFIQYVDDVPAGPIELTDEIMEELRNECQEIALTNAAEAKLQSYVDQADVVYNEDAIAAAEAALALDD